MRAKTLLACVAVAGLIGTLAAAGDVTLAWDYTYPTDHVAGFSVHWGPSSRVYTARQDLDNPDARQITVPGLTPTETVYFALTAYNAHTNRSEYSDELVWDNTPPALTWLTEALDYDVPAGAPLIMPDYRGLVAVTDNVSRPAAISIVQEPLAGAPLPIGVSTVTIWATDEAGNVAGTSKDLTVRIRVTLSPVSLTGVDHRGRQLQPVTQEDRP